MLIIGCIHTVVQSWFVEPPVNFNHINVVSLVLVSLIKVTLNLVLAPNF